MTQKNNKPVVVHMDVRKLKGKPDTNLPSFSKVKLEKLIEEAVVDAYGEKEQVGVFLTMMEEHLALPFSANITGATKSGRESASSICRCRRQRPPVRNGSQRTATGAEDSE